MSAKAVANMPELNGIKCVNYHDLPRGDIDLTENPYLAIQYESVSRIVRTGRNDCDLIVILDEFGSICDQIKSNAGNVLKTQQCFGNLIRHCNQVIALDGYLDQYQLDILEKYAGEQAYLVCNEFKNRSNHIVEHTRNQNDALNVIYNALDQGQHVICPCMDKALAETIYIKMKQRYGTSKNIALFTSDNPCKDMNINETWSVMDLVAFTSVIDTGLSFELLRYFTKCVCFYDNVSGPTHFVGVQMLSRSRDTREFVVCTTERRFKHRSTDMPTIMSEMIVKVEKCDVAFYGTQPSTTQRSRDWATSNPCLMALLRTERIQRIAKNGFETALLDILLADGAQVRELVPIQRLSDDLQHMNNDPVVIPGGGAEALLSKVKRQYNFDALDPADIVTIDNLSKTTTLEAYKLNCRLRINGPDICSALANMERLVTVIAGALDICRQSGHYNDNAITRAEILLGAVGVNDSFGAAKAAYLLIKFALGVHDIFNVPIMSESQIRERLNCIYLKSDTPKQRDVWCVPMDVKQEFLQLLDNWIACKPEIYTPYFMPCLSKQLTIVKTLHLVDHVYHTMFDASYKRTDKVCRKRGEVRDCFYEFMMSKNFAVELPDGSHCRTKPPIPAWIFENPMELAEHQLLQVGPGFVQPSTELARRLIGELSLQNLPVIMPEHIRPRERTSHANLNSGRIKKCNQPSRDKKFRFLPMTEQFHVSPNEVSPCVPTEATQSRFQPVNIPIKTYKQKKLQKKIEDTCERRQRRADHLKNKEEMLSSSDNSMLAKKEVNKDMENQAVRTQWLKEFQDDATESLKTLFSMPVFLRR